MRGLTVEGVQSIASLWRIILELRCMSIKTHSLSILIGRGCFAYLFLTERFLIIMVMEAVKASHPIGEDENGKVFGSRFCDAECRRARV